MTKLQKNHWCENLEHINENGSISSIHHLRMKNTSARGKHTIQKNLTLVEDNSWSANVEYKVNIV